MQLSERSLVEIERRRNSYTSHERYFNSILKSKYKITIEDYFLMLDIQDWKCAICDRNVKLCIDHDHTSGKVRGLLCATCNTTLGKMRDSTETLRRAIEYLEKNGK